MAVARGGEEKVRGEMEHMESLPWSRLHSAFALSEMGFIARFWAEEEYSLLRVLKCFLVPDWRLETGAPFGGFGGNPGELIRLSGGGPL